MWSSAIAAIGTVGGYFIDAVVGLAVNRLFSKQGDENLQFADEFDDWKDNLEFIKTYLEVVEKVKRNRRTEAQKAIMTDFREYLYEAEDIIDDYNLQFPTQSNQKLAKASSSSSASSLKVSKELKQSLRKLNESIRKRRDNLQYLDNARSSISSDKFSINNPLYYPIVSNEDELVGIKDGLQKIMQWFPIENEPFRVIGIVGMGGIGKTTLAQKIHDEAKSHFRCKMFVTVSRNVKLEELIRSILKKLNISKESLEGNYRDLLLMLKSKLDEKYLIVLDDVWSVTEGRWWHSLRSALPQINGSCVIVTTRNEEVAKSMGAVDGYIHRPELLSIEDCWSLFSKTAFQSNGGHCPNESLREIGKEIVSKCGRLPLAIKIVGGIMPAKGDSIQKWRQVLEELKEGFSADKKDEVLIPTLELSYEELPAHLKPCLLCFAAYPEDEEIYMLDMIYWWIGEEFVSESAKKTALDLGKEWFMELVNRCLIIGVHKDAFEEGFVACRVHDIVREMIINIARAENFIDMHDRCTSSTGVPSRRVCITTGAEEGSFKPNSKLRTLLLDTDERDWNGYGCDLSRLRIIYSMGGTRICYADWMSSLRHLTYLHLFYFNETELPDSFGSLQCLQVLRIYEGNFGGGSSLKLPSNLNSLKKLRVFEVWTILICGLEGLENLSSLHRLWLSGSACLNEPKELKQLTELRELSVWIKQDDVGEVLEVMGDLPQLKILKLRADFEKVWDNQLSPFKRLEELHLCYRGKLTAWFAPITFPNLRLLALELPAPNYCLERTEPNYCLCESLCSNPNVIWTQLEALVHGSRHCRRRFRREDISQRIESAMPSLRFLCHLSSGQDGDDVSDQDVVSDANDLWWERKRKQNGVWTEWEALPP